jgi:hypothetical protein
MLSISLHTSKWPNINIYVNWLEFYKLRLNFSISSWLDKELANIANLISERVKL